MASVPDGVEGGQMGPIDITRDIRPASRPRTDRSAYDGSVQRAQVTT